LTARRIACALLSSAIVACSPTSDRAAVSLLQTDLRETTADKGAWLQALWIAVIPKRDLEQSPARTVHAVLDELTALGLLERIDLRDRFRYHLSDRGSRYFYNENRLGDNSERWPYMCYSRIVPQRIVWKTSSRRNDGVEHVAYVSWRTTSPQTWVTPIGLEVSFVGRHPIG
jgi:hypothetical protein